MKNLQQIFGAIISIFFTTNGGVSLSEINRIQAEHKQKNDEFNAKVSDATAGIFQKEISFVGAGDSAPRTVTAPTIEVADLERYFEVGLRNAQTAVLMHGLKLHKRLQCELEDMDLTHFVSEISPEAPAYPRAERVENLPAPPSKPSPALKATTCSTEHFMELSNIEEMIAALKEPVLMKFDSDGAFYRKAQGLNSRAANIGKLLSERDSFFRELIKPMPKSVEQTIQTGVVITTWKKAYSSEAIEKFGAFRDKLQAEYDSLQKQLNGCKKQMKDAVREYNLEQERAYQTEYGKYRLAVQEHQREMERIRLDVERREEAARNAYEKAQELYALEMERIRSAAETLRQQAQQELATLRVRVD